MNIPGRAPAACLAAVFAACLATSCARTVNDHLREAESGSPEAVGEAVIAIADLLALKEANQLPFDEGDQAAVAYLRKVAQESKIQTNRSISLGGLAKLRTVKAEEVFLKSLEDPFWHARFQAVRGLKIEPREAYAEPLSRLLGRETQSEVRVEIIKTLGAIGGPAALRTLFETFLRRSSTTSRQQDEQVHAYLALKFLTGINREFYDHDGWEKAFNERFPAPQPGEGAGN